MSESFNKYAKALGKDLLTAIPRCYKTVFNDVADNGDWLDIHGTDEAFGREAIAHASALCITTNAAVVGACAGGVLPVLLAPQVTALCFLGMAAGATGLTPVGMKLYAGWRNMQLSFREQTHGISYKPIENKAYPALNKLRREMKL